MKLMESPIRIKLCTDSPLDYLYAFNFHQCYFCLCFGSLCWLSIVISIIPITYYYYLWLLLLLGIKYIIVIVEPHFGNPPLLYSFHRIYWQNEFRDFLVRFFFHANRIDIVLKSNRRLLLLFMKRSKDGRFLSVLAHFDFEYTFGINAAAPYFGTWWIYYYISTNMKLIYRTK